MGHPYNCYNNQIYSPSKNKLKIKINNKYRDELKRNTIRQYPPILSNFLIALVPLYSKILN